MVLIGSSLSNLFKLKFGFLKGSVLGPLLFPSTQHLLVKSSEYTGVKYHSYADDTQLFITLKSFD